MPLDFFIYVGVCVLVSLSIFFAFMLDSWLKDPFKSRMTFSFFLLL